jgi:hypothetical protein
VSTSKVFPHSPSFRAFFHSCSDPGSPFLARFEASSLALKRQNYTRISDYSTDRIDIGEHNRRIEILLIKTSVNTFDENDKRTRVHFGHLFNLYHGRCTRAGSSSLNLDTFTPLPKLPIESRLRVWHLSYPLGSGVNFGNEFFKSILPQGRGNTVQFEDPTPLPITLSANRESPHETLKQYTVLFRGDSQILAGESEPVERPFCYKPMPGIAWINPVCTSNRLLLRHLVYIHYICCSVSLQSNMNTRNSELVPFWQSQLFRCWGVASLEEIGDLASLREHLAPLRQFRGLKVLTLIQSHEFPAEGDFLSFS